MKALRYNGERLALAETELPSRFGEALVRITASGICKTDLEIVRGYADFRGTIGHEFVGVVEEARERRDLTGKRVVGEINAGCGECAFCLAGDPRHCPARTVLGIHGRDGAHAEFLNLPAENLLEVSSNVSDEQAVFVEPLAAAYGITEQVDIFPETKIAVIGDGKLGLLCAMSLGVKSENVSLIGKHRSKMSIVEKLGVEGVLVDGSLPKLANYFEIVVEASGSESGLATAIDLVRPRGKIVLKSTFHGRTLLDTARVVVDEISIVGSRCGRFAPALELLAENRLRVDDLISEEFRLDDGLKAMDHAAKKGVLKVLLRMGT